MMTSCAVRSAGPTANPTPANATTAAQLHSRHTTRAVANHRAGLASHRWLRNTQARVYASAPDRSWSSPDGTKWWYTRLASDGQSTKADDGDGDGYRGAV